MKTANYHEVECVSLVSGEVRPRRELHSVMRQLGLQSIDDYYVLSRKGRILPWQSSTILSFDVILRNIATYETEDDIIDSRAGEWDALEGRYLLATLPVDCIELAIKHIHELCTRLQLHLQYSGEKIDATTLRNRWQVIADNLVVNHAHPGSEELAILIESNYPRP